MQDSTKHWSLHATVPDSEAMKHKFEEIVGFPVNYELISCAPWRQNLLLADRYRDGRVFLAGDSVHLVIPTGGLGMNTGVGDAFDLAWKLIGTLKGWGGPELLDSYEIEAAGWGKKRGCLTVCQYRPPTMAINRHAGYFQWHTPWGSLKTSADSSRRLRATQREPYDRCGTRIQVCRLALYR